MKRQNFPIILIITIAVAIVSASIWHPQSLLFVGSLVAWIVSLTVTALYLVLVPVRRNPGAKRLIGLLVAIDALLTTSVLRYFFHDYPFREEILTILFWSLAAALAYLGWHIWKDQIEGARAYRDNHRKTKGSQDHGRNPNP